MPLGRYGCVGREDDAGGVSPLDDWNPPVGHGVRFLSAAVCFLCPRAIPVKVYINRIGGTSGATRRQRARFGTVFGKLRKRRRPVVLRPRPLVSPVLCVIDAQGVATLVGHMGGSEGPRIDGRRPEFPPRHRTNFTRSLRPPSDSASAVTHRSEQ